MVLEVGKKSEIRLKSEDSVPCLLCLDIVQIVQCIKTECLAPV